MPLVVSTLRSVFMGLDMRFAADLFALVRKNPYLYSQFPRQPIQRRWTLKSRI